MSGINLHLSFKETPWQSGNLAPHLPAEQIHVWRLNLKQQSANIDTWSTILSAEEIAAFQRFHFEIDRDYRSTTRAALRYLLACYTRQEPNQIKMAYQTFGKPFLVEFPNLFFNVSHSKDIALLAFTYIGEIGVDVEQVDKDIKVDRLAKNFFSPVEVPVILGSSPAEKPIAFFKAWTRKEAVIKAHGKGLSLPLRQFGVNIRPDLPVSLLHMDWDPTALASWQLFSFTPAADYLGAIALMGRPKAVRFLDLQLPEQLSIQRK